MKIFLSCVLVSVALTPVVFAGDASAEKSQARKANTREFTFHYSAKLRSLSQGTKVRIWFPVPQTDRTQTVRTAQFKAPTRIRLANEPVHGNKVAYFEEVVDGSGNIKFTSSYEVERSEVRALVDQRRREKVAKLTDDEYERYLSANKRVPIDGKPISLLDELTFTPNPIETARKLYDRVDLHVKYDKSNPGYGNGDVLWVCDSQFGNCTDFHSLFISFARSKGIPAKFEIGFPLPPKRGEGKIGGYHCWGWFYTDDHGWVPVDISEADKHPELKEYYFGNINENRIAFSSGRDIDLVPEQAGPPLNFFVYPYAEVDGVPLPKEQIEVEFRFVDKESS